MANFNLFIPNLIEAEGGYQINENDAIGNTNSNGEFVGTNHGISASTYEDYLGHAPSEQEMRDMTKEEALHIFETLFWNNLAKATQINSQAIAETLTDMVINARSQGVKLMQEVLNDYFDYNLIEDNIMGNLTLNAINSVNEHDLFERYTTARHNYYDSLEFSTNENLRRAWRWANQSWRNRVNNLYNKHINNIIEFIDEITITATNNPEKSILGVGVLSFLILLLIKKRKKKK